MSFLPVTRADMEERGWEQLDFIFVSGDAYVDHPSFGPAILCRLLEKHGYKVGIIPQPDWHHTKDFTSLGKPRLGFLVSSGNLDSQLNRYTAAKRLRHDDSYSPGGKAGKRPERAVLVYTRKLRECWGEQVPIIIGGIEASLRRFAHYDYWQNEVRASILAECPADLLVYGMGERQLIDIAAQLHQGVSIENIQDVQGTCFKVPNFDYIWDYTPLPSLAEVKRTKRPLPRPLRWNIWSRMLFEARSWLSRMGSFVLCRINQLCPFPQRKWTKSTICLTKEIGILCMMLQGECQLSRRSNSVLQPSEGALVAVISVLLSPIRAGLFSLAVMSPLFGRLSALPRNRTSRDIFTMWEALPPTFIALPVICS